MPDAQAGTARVQFDPPLAGVQTQTRVPLAPPGTACGDWRASLRAELADPARLAFLGAYPASCGERSWAVAYADPGAYAARAIEGLWRRLGGKLTGSVRYGPVPAALRSRPSACTVPLAEVVRDINIPSSNVAAAAVSDTGALQAPTATATLERAVLQQKLVAHALSASAAVTWPQRRGL